MKDNLLQNLLDTLSGDFVLASIDEPDSISALLPVLKQIHTTCLKLSLKNKAKNVLELRKQIDEILKTPDDDLLKMLGDSISELSLSFDRLSNTDDNFAEPKSSENLDQKNTDQEILNEKIVKINELLEYYSKAVGEFCPDDLPDLGAMILLSHRLIDICTEDVFNEFRNISNAILEYVENLSLENMRNTKPIEEGLVLLKSILAHIKIDEEWVFDYSDVLELLSREISDEDEKKQAFEATLNEIEKEDASLPTPDLDQTGLENHAKKKISDDDVEIMIDFVSEALESLESIEVNLIDLEQDPSNKDIINEIFRPFHTIKGVSGFLALNKINKLAHATENLLDSARSGEFLINDTATDTILESVDMLKKMIYRVEEATQTGFLESDADINIEYLRDKLQQLQITLTTGEKQPIGEILINKGDISEENLDRALEIQKENPNQKLGEILVQEKKADPSQVASALMDQTFHKRSIATQVKVSTEKLDDLVDYAGELVIAQSMLRQKTAHDTSLTQSVTQLGQIVTNMQNIAMSMRMIPIKATFMKMIRLVRDLSKKSGKEIHLEMKGEDTEIDRNVVDAIYEPMVHMIRNSCDHGIESPSDRSAMGKPSHGNVTLRAYHKGGHIMIEIEDDGKGLDKEKILEKATATGLLSGNEQLTDPQIYDLILQPGFSTAKEITDVSGRGVGMDVVTSGIEKFRGNLSIESEKGKGTKFTISLPLTLAIIDGMLIRVDDEKYVIPTIAIQKAFKPKKDECFTVEGKGEMVKDRGNLIPVIRLNEMYNSSTERKVIWDGLIVVVESKEEKRAILIDELLGKDEFVIKSLGDKLEDVKGLAGGAILSDGRVGLILDIHGIFQIVND